MCDNGNSTSVEAALPAAIQGQAQATRLPLQCRRRAGFTLAELLVSVGVLVLLVFLSTQLINSATTVAILGNKRMDADSEARQILDRMAIDFAQMVKRTDVDYYVKLANGQQRQNDQIAFYSAVPGYNPSSAAASSVSLLTYRVNSNPASSSYNKMERLGKGLVWNGASTTDSPVVFLPLTISNTWCQATITGTPSAICAGTPDPTYEVIGPDVFRFEYYYLLTNGALSDAPCLDAANCNTLNAWRDVAAIAVDLAVIDPRSKVLLTDQQIATFNGNSGLTNFLNDWSSDLNRPGKLITSWQNKLNSVIRTASVPRQASSGIRFYERYFYLNQ
jgi:type II secretory pathway component PulJ